MREIIIISDSIKEVFQHFHYHGCHIRKVRQLQVKNIFIYNTSGELRGIIIPAPGKCIECPYQREYDMCTLCEEEV